MNEIGECIMPFGKYKGAKLDDMWASDDQIQYLDWLATKSPDNITNVAIKLWLEWKGEHNE